MKVIGHFEPGSELEKRIVEFFEGLGMKHNGAGTNFRTELRDLSFDDGTVEPGLILAKAGSA